MRRLLALALLLVISTEAKAASSGMYLCRSPAIASHLWGDITAIAGTGVRVTQDQLRTLASKDECPFIESPSLRPIDYVAGELLITDGKTKGWAEPHMFIYYVNGKPSAK